MLLSVSLHNLSFSTPDGRPLFTDIELSFGPGRNGLIGRNGTGKSTLLNIIAGRLAPASGSVAVSGTIGMLHQAVQVSTQATIAEELGVADALARLQRLEDGAGTIEDAGEADWTLPARVDEALNEVGLPSLSLERAVASLSGGQRTRLSVARLLLQEPDILLLDEPTNNLDADGRRAIAELLERWRGMAIVVSHDRTLLRQMDFIIELTSLGATSYGGNWDHYVQRKQAELAAAEHGLASAERRMAEIDRKIQTASERKSRKDGAGKRKAARGDIPRIMLGGLKENAENTSDENARLANRLRSQAAAAADDARAKVEILTPLSVSLVPTGLPAGRTVLQADTLTGGPDPDQPIIRDLSLHVVGPERVAVTGPNGSGKTTLLRLLTGALDPVSGTVQIQVPYAVLDQTVSLLEATLSIKDNFRRLNPHADENTCRAALARFMFRADSSSQIVGTLSGGEMLRAGLACTIGGNNPPQLLILDEPTNHLDIHAIEEVEAGLRGYDGALLVVSHDADLLAALGTTRTVTLDN